MLGLVLVVHGRNTTLPLPDGGRIHSAQTGAVDGALKWQELNQQHRAELALRVDQITFPSRRSSDLCDNCGSAFFHLKRGGRADRARGRPGAVK